MALLQITIHNSPQIEAEIAEAVLAKIGLTSNQLRQEFYSTYGYANLLEFFQRVLYDPKNARTLANIAKTVKKAGKVTFSFEVSDKMISDVKEFFALRENKFSDRVNDAGKQGGTALKNALGGIKRNKDEAVNDVDKGLGRTAGGLWNSLTEPVASKKFGEGIDDVRKGLYQFTGGVLKYNIQTPLDAGMMYFGGDADARQTLLGTNIGRSLNLVRDADFERCFRTIARFGSNQNQTRLRRNLQRRLG